MVQTLIKRTVLTPMTKEIKIEFNFIEEFNELKDILGQGYAVNEQE